MHEIWKIQMIKDGGALRGTWGDFKNSTYGTAFSYTRIIYLFHVGTRLDSLLY